MRVAIIDYGSGNLRSAAKALERAAGEAGITTDIRVTSDPDTVRRADRVVMPGQGAFGDCRRGLDAIPGMLEALTDAVITRGRPFFGICVGIQQMVQARAAGVMFTLNPLNANTQIDVGTALAVIDPDDQAISIVARDAVRKEGSTVDQPQLFAITRVGDLSGSATVVMGVRPGGSSSMTEVSRSA